MTIEELKIAKELYYDKSIKTDVERCASDNKNSDSHNSILDKSDNRLNTEYEVFLTDPRRI